jgi:hypothetical protein
MCFVCLQVNARQHCANFQCVVFQCIVLLCFDDGMFSGFVAIVPKFFGDGKMPFFCKDCCLLLWVMMISSYKVCIGLGCCTFFKSYTLMLILLFCFG